MTCAIERIRKVPSGLEDKMHWQKEAVGSQAMAKHDYAHPRYRQPYDNDNNNDHQPATAQWTHLVERVGPQGRGNLLHGFPMVVREKKHDLFKSLSRDAKDIDGLVLLGFGLFLVVLVATPATRVEHVLAQGGRSHGQSKVHVIAADERQDLG